MFAVVVYTKIRTEHIGCPVLPDFDFFNNRIRGKRDTGEGYFYLVSLFQMALNLTRCYALRVKRKCFVVEAIKLSLRCQHFVIICLLNKYFVEQFCKTY
jgi:hypothetical protein